MCGCTWSAHACPATCALPLIGLLCGLTVSPHARLHISGHLPSAVVLWGAGLRLRVLGQGVMLQHSAVVAVVAGILRFLKQARARGFQGRRS